MKEIKVTSLCKAYDGKTVLADVSFTVGVGITRIAGASGVGKTTLLRILLSLETPDSGEINAPALRWSAVFQENRLLEGMDAKGNLRFALGADYDETVADTVLCELGLGDVGDKRVRDYSGGMKRRLALARALLASCDAIALDEPFTGMDNDNRAAALACILRAAEDKIVLLATHDAVSLPDNTPVVELG